MEYSSNAKGNLAVTLGAIGTGLGAIGNSGLFQDNGYNGRPHHFVTRDELGLVKELAMKDSQIALLHAESTAEDKMVEVYKQSHSEVVALRERMDEEVKELRHQIDCNRREQDMWNANQSVANAHMSSAISTNTNSIKGIEAIINEITQIKVPNHAVCPGWGDVRIIPIPAVAE